MVRLPLRLATNTGPLGTMARPVITVQVDNTGRTAGISPEATANAVVGAVVATGEINIVGVEDTARVAVVDMADTSSGLASCSV